VLADSPLFQFIFFEQRLGLVVRGLE
jgi:hypothetical protein